MVLPWSMRPNLPAPICLCHHSSPGFLLTFLGGLESGCQRDSFALTKERVRCLDCVRDQIGAKDNATKL